MATPCCLINPANFINTSLYTNLKFNFVRDIAPIASFNRVPNVMTVNKDVPAKNVAEFIAYVKANPGKVNMASSGNGTSVHLSGEMFMAMTGTEMQHVPYRGAAPAITDMLGGQVQVIFDNMPSIIQHIRAGSLRALAVTTAERSSQLPDVPPIAETVPGYEASALFGMGAPKNTPKEIIEKLNSEINAILAEPEMKQAPGRTGRRAADPVAGGFWRADQGRNREMEEGRRVRRPQGRVIGGTFRRMIVFWTEASAVRGGDETMRKLVLAMMALAAAGAANLATSAPAAAYDYPWCVQGRDTGIPGDCSYQTYAQCMASASGRFAYCNVNPRVAFGRLPRRGRSTPTTTEFP